MRTSLSLALLAALLLAACSAPPPAPPLTATAASPPSAVGRPAPSPSAATGAPATPTAAPAASGATAIPSAVPAGAPAAGGAAAATVQTNLLRLATTTATVDSGLLDALLPAFKAQSGAQVAVVAASAEQALALASKGDVDVVLVHDRPGEDALVAAGDGLSRRDVMSTDWVIVGPVADPAGVRVAASASAAFNAIARAQAPFASRADGSDTFAREQGLWAAAGLTPTKDLPWYRPLGQGMDETLVAANSLGAYALADRSGWLAGLASLPNLTLLFGGATADANPDQALVNPYGVVVVNPARHPGVNADLAEEFAAWLTSPETQAAIGSYGSDIFGQSLFHPAGQP